MTRWGLHCKLVSVPIVRPSRVPRDRISTRQMCLGDSFGRTFQENYMRKYVLSVKIREGASKPASLGFKKPCGHRAIFFGTFKQPGGPFNACKSSQTS